MNWTRVLLVAALAWAGAAPAAAAPMAAPADVTAEVVANRDIILTGDTVVRLTGGTVTYTGVVSGQGTFTVAGSGRLILTRDSDFTLPPGRQRQKLVTYNGNHPITRLDNPDPPAVIVEKGATLQYGPGDGTTGELAHYVPRPGGSWNTLNIRVDGTLDMALHRLVHFGIMSGSGLIIARTRTWPGTNLSGTHPFSGVFVNGTGFSYGAVDYNTQTPQLKTIVNHGSAIHHAANGQTTVNAATFYSKVYGNDINYHTWGSGVVRNTGVYTWSDNESLTNPTLSDPALNYANVPHRNNKRGINIEGANVEWGDGTNNRFFLPGNESTVYINMHFDGRERSKLTLNYNGPVTLDAPISGGKYHDTLAAPGEGDVVIAGTPGNQVTFTAPQNYNGSTTIGRNATLRLGDGTAGGDSGLRVGGRYEIINSGTLVVQNAKQGLSLGRISGSGAVTQAGAATTTVTDGLTYRGVTTVSRGTLKLAGGSLGNSSGVKLTGAGATLDLSAAGAQTLKDLSGAAGTTVSLGTSLTVGSGVFSGALVGPKTVSLAKVGTGTLALTGQSDTRAATWTVREGVLKLDTTSVAVAADIAVGKGGTLQATAGLVTGDIVNDGTVSVTGLSVSGGYTQRAGAKLTAAGMAVSGQVTLAGTLVVPDGTETTTVIDNKGTGPVIGTFDGWVEGAAVAGRTITYTGGDGNDVVLVSAAGPGSQKVLAGSGSPSAFPTLLVSVIAAALVTGAAVLLLWYRRRRRSGTA